MLLKTLDWDHLASAAWLLCISHKKLSLPLYNPQSVIMAVAGLLMIWYAERWSSLKPHDFTLMVRATAAADQVSDIADVNTQTSSDTAIALLSHLRWSMDRFPVLLVQCVPVQNPSSLWTSDLWVRAEEKLMKHSSLEEPQSVMKRLLEGYSNLSKCSWGHFMGLYCSCFHT